MNNVRLAGHAPIVSSPNLKGRQEKVPIGQLLLMEKCRLSIAFLGAVGHHGGCVSKMQIETIELCRSFQMGRDWIVVLRGVNLKIFCGESVFVCGASGAGKTTLLYTLAGLERPESGKVIFEGKSIYEMGSVPLAKLRNSRMGFVFQSYFLFPELTALENILLPAMIAGCRPTDRAKQLLEQVGLGERKDHLPSELSGGEQQRVAIARALINRPVILFADEPTGNLDAHVGKVTIQLLLSLVRQEKLTLVAVTHDQNLAQYGDRQVWIENGVTVTLNE